MTDIRQRWLAPRWLFTIATVLGLIAAIEHYVEMQHATDPLGWGHALGWRLPFWYLWALFAPLVAAGARRVSLTRQAWVGRGLVLLGFGVALSLAHAALELTAQRAVAPQFFDGGLWSAYLGSAGSWLPTNLLAFGALVGVTYASDFQDRYREQQLAASRLSAQLAQAELHALRMQLNPHFLFNAMNSVAMLVRHGEQTEAVRTIAALSDLLRLLLDEQRPDELPLRDLAVSVDCKNRFSVGGEPPVLHSRQGDIRFAIPDCGGVPRANRTIPTPTDQCLVIRQQRESGYRAGVAP